MRPVTTCPTGVCVTCGTKHSTSCRTYGCYGDLVLAAFFAGSKPAERETARALHADAVMNGTAGQYRSMLEDLREGSPPLVPFHWDIEFPEVFDHERPGFDAIIGNPPFAGGRNLSEVQGKTYSDWLLALNEGSSGGADLVAHFYRRSFGLLRPRGTFGLIATNTIGQGDTRATGLCWICNHGGDIYSVRKRIKWPGHAAVIVSVVHIMRGRYPGQHLLDGRSVDRITAYLFHAGGNDNPVRLAVNARKSFQGLIVLGMGFTFDDTDTKGVATPITEMRRLIAKNPTNARGRLPLCRRRGGQHQPDAGAPSLRDRLRRPRQSRLPRPLAGADVDRGRQGETRAGC